jgi:hypothetical protein
VFLVISSPELDLVDEIVSILQKNGAKNVYTKKVSDTSTHYLNQPCYHITHIIANTTEFIEYSDALESMIPVTSNNWVLESVSAQKLVNPAKYNPDPKFFMKDCYVCVADNLPMGDKEVIYGGVKAFGGNYLDVLTKFTTHLIAVDLSNEKSIIASSAIDDGEVKIDIKIVLPHWIDHCIMAGKRLDETPYLLPNPPILQKSPSAQIDLIDDFPTSSPKTEFFTDKTFYISSDYNLSERLSLANTRLIESQGGKVISTFDVDVVDIYIGKYRAGAQYRAAFSSSTIVVANLQWLYHIIVNQKWILPINSNLLHYPYPIHHPLNNLQISITNYSGDARIYLSKLIELLGGTFTKTLTKENDYLIVAKPEGKKYNTAKYKWLNENNEPIIKTVNHLWLEECYANGELLDDSQLRYAFLGRNNDGLEFLLGKTKLIESKLAEPEKDEHLEEIRSDAAEVGYLENDEEIERRDPPVKQVKEVPASRQISNVQAIDTPDAQVVSSAQPDSSLTQDKSQLNDEQIDQVKETDEDQNTATNEKSQEVEIVQPRLGRSAAKKAALKLHNAMDDLNEYQKMVKSVTKMKTYMEELETTLTPTKRSKTASPTPNKKTKSSPSLAASKSAITKYDITAVMTGCELEVTLNKLDISKLAKVGIKIYSEFSHKLKINTLIAPKILRTEKFLSSLSKVNRIVHPKYVIDVLRKLEECDIINEDPEIIVKSVDIDNYSLDRILPVQEINQELGYKSKGNGLKNLVSSIKPEGLFAETSLNLSSNLNGGIDIISKILKIHGMKDYKEVKMTANLEKKLIPFEEGGQYILVAHKTKDTKLINAFKKLKRDSNFKGIVVEWDWCVKSIFQMKLQDLNQFAL